MINKLPEIGDKFRCKETKVIYELSVISFDGRSLVLTKAENKYGSQQRFPVIENFWLQFEPLGDTKPIANIFICS